MISDGSVTFDRDGYSFRASTPASRHAWYTDVFIPGITSLFEEHSVYRVVRSVHLEGASVPTPTELGSVNVFAGAGTVDSFAYLFLEGVGDAKTDAIVIGLADYDGAGRMTIGVGRRINGAWEQAARAEQATDDSVLTQFALQAPYTLLVSKDDGTLVEASLVPRPEDSHVMRITVNPSHVLRTLTLGSGATCSLPIGVASVMISTILDEDTFTIGADGFTTVTTDLLPTTDQLIELPKLEGTRRIAINTSPDATVRYRVGNFLDRESLGPDVLLGTGSTAFDLAITDACYVTATRGGVTKGTWLDASEVDQVRDLTFYGSVETPVPPGPEITDPPIIPEGMMVLRCKVAVPGTLRYDNDGFLDEVDPIEVTAPGVVDYTIPAPQVGCSGGTLEFNPVSGGGSHFRSIVFAPDTYLTVPIGPMLITVVSDADGQVFWDADGLFQWLPGDGEPISNIVATTPVQFSVDCSGYVNVAIAGTDTVVRVHCEFLPGGTKDITIGEGNIADATAAATPWMYVGAAGAGFLLGLSIAGR